MIRSFVLMLTFLTRIPIPMRFEFEDKDFAKGLLFLPLIGLIIGLPLYVYRYFVDLKNPMLTGFILIVIYVGMTGGLHLDGLADYFDGMFSGRKRSRILEIMKDSAIGTFGVVGLCLYFLGMLVGLSMAEPMAVLLMPVVSRTIGLLFCSFGNYPKDAGMGQPMVDYGKWYHGVSSVLLIFCVLYAAGTWYLIAGLVTCLLMAVFFLRTTQVIGGITGDVIGASIEVSQVIWLLSFAVLGGL